MNIKKIYYNYPAQCGGIFVSVIFLILGICFSKLIVIIASISFILIAVFMVLEKTEEVP